MIDKNSRASHSIPLEPAPALPLPDRWTTLLHHRLERGQGGLHAKRGDPADQRIDLAAEVIAVMD
jgi:hypothetical protein